MPNNFKQTADFFVSKSGLDTNAGTADSPKLTIAGAVLGSAINQTLALGSGLYFEGFNAARNVGGDGIVKILGNGSNSWTGGNGYYYVNLSFENISFITPFSFIQQCFFKDCTVSPDTGGSGVTNFNSSIFVNCTISGAVGPGSFSSCIFVNCTFTNYNITNGANLFINNYVDPNSTILFNSWSGSAINNNIQGFLGTNIASVVTTGVIQDKNNNYYDLTLVGSGGSGTAVNPFRRGNTATGVFNLSNFSAAYTVAVTNINVNPLYNSIANLDFTLQANSPHRFYGSGGTIGNTQYAFAKYVGIDPEATAQATLTNLSGISDLVITTGASGTFLSGPVQASLSLALVELGIMHYVGAIYHNKSATGGTAQNQNVPDSQVFAGSDVSGGGNPDRLCFELRWSTKATAPVVAGDWDNGGAFTAAAFQKFMWNKKVSYDNTNKTNADPAYSVTSPQSFVGCTFYQIKVTLTNAYN